MINYLIYIICLGAGMLIVYLFLNSKYNEAINRVRSKLSRINPQAMQVNVSNNAIKSLAQIEEAIDAISEPKVMKLEKLIDDKVQIEFEKMTERFNNLQIVNELGQRVTSSLSLKETFDHLYKTINSAMDASVFEMSIYSWKENTWHVLSNWDMPRIDEANPYYNHIAEWSLMNKREVILFDAEKDFARYVDRTLILPNKQIPQSVISFPVTHADVEVGVLSVMSFSKNAYNDYQLEMLRSILPYTAVAIGNALIHEELVSTQTQLIQNEKMASLGELTSGIAHEIQNPLNFVNNFADVSNELLEEMCTELNQGNTSEAIAIAEDVKQNLEKISFHGKRADGIVKGMLQHSRSSNGQKEMTDINQLADEYTRLSYHGLRAKDKSFNATINSDLDQSLGKMNVVPQDLGRVLLNLLTNAFYSVAEKNKLMQGKLLADGTSYVPTVWVSTKKLGGKVEIKIRDNGNGIPKKIIDKIYQPFFTTKPTGQGTGLGLSLSYDIITKGHGGELKVDSKEGEYAEFIIII